MLSPEITQKSHQLLKALKNNSVKLSAAESCTGGLFSAAMTEIPGASEIFERGYITYSNDAKIELLTVPTFFIDSYGAVSSQTAIAMAEGALLMSKSQISISITGIAGPEGGTEEKPVGTVYIACAQKGCDTIYEKHNFSGSRHKIRCNAIEASIDLLINQL